MADAKDYLELWRERYSFPSYIGDNFRLSEDGTIVLDNEEEWSEAQRILLQGSAVGTSKNFYLDPKPLFNKLGEIYTNIINSSFTSARTDSIKMNRNNMDYTNGSGLLVDQTPVYPFFCFLYNTPENVTSKEVYDDWYNENVVIDIVTAISNNNIDTSIAPNKITIDSKLLEDKHFPSFTKVEAVTLENYLNYYKEWYNMSDYKETFNNLFNTSSDSSETFWNKHWYEIKTVNSETLEQQTFYLPNEKFVEQFRLFKKKMLDKVRGLQLLMPQYHRRVEVEDLDENFWVISIILDAVVNALWGPYGLIDVIRQLILKVTQIEDFLGLDKLTGIELLHNGSNDIYFDMYSRFTLSGLELKLKTQNGERIIKNIFKGQSDTSDRNSTTDAYDTREELFAGIQLNEITPTINGMKSTGLYDSDLISSSSKVPLDDNNREVTKYLSLNTVIDAINNKIVSNNDAAEMTYTYSNSECEEFFANLDITPDGTLTPNDLKQLSLDVTGDFSNLTQYELSRLSKYKDAKTWLENNFEKLLEKDLWKNIFTKLGIENKTDIEKLFITKKGLMTFSVNELDENGDNILSNEEWLQYANDQLSEIGAYIDELYNNTSESISTLSLLYGGSVTSVLNLCEVYKKLETYFYRKQVIENSTEDIYPEYIIETINVDDLSTINRYYRQLEEYDKTSSTMTIILQGSLETLVTSAENDPYGIQIHKNTDNQMSILDDIYAISNNYDPVNSPIRTLIVKTTKSDEKPIEYTDKQRIEKQINSYIRYNDTTARIIKNSAYESFKINTKPYNAMGVSPLEDIYTYNEFTAQIIAKYLAEKEVLSGNYNNFFYQIDDNIDFYKYYFDTSKNGEMDANDCSNILKYLNLTNDAYYFYNMKLLRDSIKEGSASPVDDKSLDV